MSDAALAEADALPARDHNNPPDPIALVSETPSIALTDKETRALFVKALGELGTGEVDIADKEVQATIRSAATDLRSLKSSIEKAGKVLTEGWRIQTKQTNEIRDDLIAQCQAAHDRIRAPLTAFEAIEKARDARVRAAIGMIDEIDGRIGARSALAEVDDALDRLLQMPVSEETMGAEAEAVADYRAKAVARISAERISIAEFAALKAEMEKRNAEDAARIAREAAAQVELERAAAEEKRIAAAKAQAEADAIANAAAAAQRQRDEETAQRRREDDARDAAHAAALKAQQEKADAEIAAANAKAAEVERAAQVERDRIAADKLAADQAAAAKVEADRIAAAAEAKRVANVKHRERVNAKAATAISSVILEAADLHTDAVKDMALREAVASAIVLAIAAGTIPGIKIEY